VLYAFVLEAGVPRVLIGLGVDWSKPLDVRAMWSISREAMAMIGAILIVFFCSSVLTNYMVTAQIPQKLVGWMH
jgi:TRAP-type C4-dicarboxylate transport system permease large subunit